MSTLIWNLILPVMIVLSTASPGAGLYYVDPSDGVIEVASAAGSGPLIAGTNGGASSGWRTVCNHREYTIFYFKG